MSQLVEQATGQANVCVDTQALSRVCSALTERLG